MPLDTALETASLDLLPNFVGSAADLIQGIYKRYAPLAWVHSSAEMMRLRPEVDTEGAIAARRAEEEKKKREMQEQARRLEEAFHAFFLVRAHVPESMDTILVTRGLQRPESTAIRTALWTGWYVDLASTAVVTVAVLYAALPLVVGDMQTQFFGPLIAHGIICMVTKGFSLERTGSNNSENNPRGQLISKDVALLMQTISSQAVLISSMALFSTSQWDVIIRRLFHLTSYKGGILGAHRVILDDQLVHNLAVFFTPARLIGQTIGMVFIGPMVLTLSDRVSSFMIRGYVKAQKSKRNDAPELDETHHDYLRQLSVLRIAGQGVAAFAQIWLPYLISQHSVTYYLGFAFGGLGYGAKYFIEDLVKHTPKTKEDWANIAFRVAMAAALGMVLYPMMPWYMIVPDTLMPDGKIAPGNVTNAILLGTAICAVDAVTKQFVLPALSDSKMTWGEKLDLAVSAMTVAAIVGFTLSASLYTQNAAGGYVMMATGFSPHLPGMLGFLLYLVAMPILYRMKEEGRFVDKVKEVEVSASHRLQVCTEERMVLLSNTPGEKSQLILSGKIMVGKGDAKTQLTLPEGEYIIPGSGPATISIARNQRFRVLSGHRILLIGATPENNRVILGGKVIDRRNGVASSAMLEEGVEYLCDDPDITTTIEYDDDLEIRLQYDNNLGFLEKLTKNFPAKERIKYSTNQFIFDILANIFGSVMVTNAFNMVLGSEAYKVVGDWLAKQALTNQWLADFLNWYQVTTGSPLSYTLAFGFCMSFIFIGMDHIYKRLYQSGAKHDVLKVSHDDGDTQYTFVEILWRFAVEMSKYTMRFALTEVIYKNLIAQGTVLIDPLFDKFMCYVAVHLLTGLTIGFLRKAAKELIISPKRKEHWQELWDQPVQKFSKWTVGALVFAFDQVFYYFNGAATDKVVEDYREGITDSHTTGIAWWSSVGAMFIEVAEIVYWELLEAFGKLVGLLDGVDTMERDIALG